MSDSNHYDTLHVNPTATPAEIKQSYRRLVKLFHPDSKSETANHEQIIQLNSAYEVLSDTHRRRDYDRQLHQNQQNRQQRAADAQNQYWRHRETARDADEHLQRWLKQVYVPVNRLVGSIVNPLSEQIEQLSADPFDDELMATFQAYLEDCRHNLDRAQLSFRSLPNPATVAGVAACLYYCLNHLADGIEELNTFALNYDEHYLHNGQELFRIATNLSREARDALKAFA